MVGENISVLYDRERKILLIFNHKPGDVTGADVLEMLEILEERGIPATDTVSVSVDVNYYIKPGFVVYNMEDIPFQNDEFEGVYTLPLA